MDLVDKTNPDPMIGVFNLPKNILHAKMSIEKWGKKHVVNSRNGKYC